MLGASWRRGRGAQSAPGDTARALAAPGPLCVLLGRTSCDSSQCWARPCAAWAGLAVCVEPAGRRGPLSAGTRGPARAGRQEPGPVTSLGCPEPPRLQPRTAGGATPTQSGQGQVLFRSRASSGCLSRALSPFTGHRHQSCGCLWQGCSLWLPGESCFGDRSPEKEPVLRRAGTWPGCRQRPCGHFGG